MKAMLHWNVFEKRWTVRTYKSCARFDSVLVKNWKTEVKPEKKDNPRGWVFTDHNNVILNPEKSLVQMLVKKEKLLYNKEEMFFNITEGDMLYCDGEGCYVVGANA